MRKKAEGITQTKRLCTFSFSFLFSSPHLSLSLSFFNRDEEDDEKILVVEILVLQISFRLCNSLSALHPVLSLPATLSLHFTKDPQFSTSSFFNSSRGGEKKGAGGKKKRRKEPVQRLVGWLDGETPTVFRSLECPCTRGNTNPGSYASCAIDLSLQGSCLALYSIDPGHSRTLILDLLCVYFYICIP